MRYYIPLLAILLACQSEPQFTKEDGLIIREILHHQEEAWSRGSIDDFMIGYLESDSLVFVSKSGLTYGYNELNRRYKKAYPDPEDMGQLHFHIDEFRPLSAKNVLVVGRWHLKRSEEKGDLEGYFTLLWEKNKDGWKIIADHSS